MTSVTIPDTEVHTIASSVLGRDVELWVAQPAAPSPFAPPQPTAVLWLLDANPFFGTAAEMTRLMSRLYGELPPILVVGVAYPTDDPDLQSDLRSKDFTPSVDPQIEAMFETMAGNRDVLFPAGERTGGAPDFLRFLEEEAKPFVSDRYPDVTGPTALFGSSLGGLFATYGYFRAPTFVDHWIAASPALYWNGNEPFDYPLPDASDTSIIFIIGEHEEPESMPQLAHFKLITNATAMAARIAEDGKARSATSVVVQGETHTSVVPAALTRGLRVFLGPATPR